MEKQKQCVSVRLSNGDIQKIKRIAARIGASDSDVIRFAIKGMLSKLLPLADENNSGAELLPVFLEYWNEVAQHFDFDVERLDLIINSGDGDGPTVAHEDIELLAMHSVFPNYLKVRLEKILGHWIDDQDVAPQLRDYLYKKYGHSVHDNERPA